MIIMAQMAHAILILPAFHLLEFDFIIRGHLRCGAIPKPGYRPGASAMTSDPACLPRPIVHLSPAAQRKSSAGGCGWPFALRGDKVETGLYETLRGLVVQEET
jgi:hypothetical protein